MKSTRSNPFVSILKLAAVFATPDIGYAQPLVRTNVEQSGSLTNSSPITVQEQPYAIHFYGLGENGASSDDNNATDGQNSGNIDNFTNTSQGTLSSTSYSGQGYGVYLQLQGGTGGTYTSTDNHEHNAGSGGSAGDILGINQASISAFGDFSGGFLGIRASSLGGDGGNVGDSGDTNTGQGGSGGSGGSVTLINSGVLQLGTAGTPLQFEGGASFEGLSAASRGGAAGYGLTAKGGAISGNLVVDNSGAINMALLSNGTSQNATSVYGIYAKSVGGAGADSFTDKNSGGSGGYSGSSIINVTAGGDIHVSGLVSANPVTIRGAGIGAITEGGAGGRGFSGDFDTPSYGGRGGNAGLIGLNVTDASVTVIGDYLPGISGIATGGKGGDGSSAESNHSFSGAGGSAGAVTANVTRTVSGTSMVSTTGSNASGILVSNAGGIGGTSYLKSGSGGAAGAGGNGGSASNVAVTLNAAAGAIQLTTNGTLSHGVEARSAGGAGGTGGTLNVIAGEAGPGDSTSGDAGVGARSGDINVSLSGAVTIATQGLNSDGIRAVSSGGAGGGGGKATIDTASSNGKVGGRGGDSGNIMVAVSDGSGISTTGDESSAITAWSLSGAGGAGGAAAVGSSDSGNGGAGGNTGTVHVTNNGILSTLGTSSYGIFAQAFAGGGGVSGFASSPFSSETGNGGASGINGAISLTNGGQITTSGQASYGMFAQSLGGQGGAAGDSELGIVSLGGTGGIPSNGGVITLTGTTDYQVATSGKSAHGALLQSIGGGGGDGGASEGFNTIGGTGTGGGGGGTVNATLTGGSTTTRGDLSAGLLMQSVGGGGGNGGDSKATSLFGAQAIGGNGGKGGNGGLVNLTSTGNFTTSGSKSVGVLAQSIGGGGGNGGSAFSTAVGVIVASAVAVGGNGVQGGDGNTVTLTFNGGQIRTGVVDTTNYEPSNTLPVDAFGILAQSIGRGGGNGGSAVANAVAIAPPTPEVQVSVAVASSTGGIGGTGGNGGLVNMGIFDGTSVVTQGQGSHGVIGQSIGGGGGNGGDSSALASSIGYGRVASKIEAKTFSLDVDVAMGGNGGTGASGGEVEITLGGTGGISGVQTYGDYSNGIQAQSIGGGGGNGGVGSGITQGYGSSNSVNVSIALGGVGGSGGNGGNATVTINPSNFIKVAGSGSHGVVVHSIGGGGGTSQGGMISFGADVGISTTTGEGQTGGAKIKEIAAGIDVGFSLGATGASGGNGGTAFAFEFGTIDTYGDDSTALIVQSIGGGGGIAGAAGADASADNPVQIFGTVRSLIDKGLFKVLPIKGRKELELGSLDSGNAGNGGSASAKVSSYITTRGDWSQGVVIQSVGGGGGRGGVATVAGSGSDSTLAMSVGGKGHSSGGSSEGASNSTGTGSNGGSATLEMDGMTISTGDSTGSGFGAYGIVVQSVGGGGGMAADGSDSNSGDISVGNGERDYKAPSYDPSGREVNPGHQASDGVVSGNGGAVTLTGGGTVTTQGIAAHGVVLQSIGAGGGIGGAGTSSDTVGVSDINLTVGGAPTSQGWGGNVIIEEGTRLNITTNGDSAFGLLAQSIGGGGGLGVAVDPTSISIGGAVNSSSSAQTNFGGLVGLSLSGETRILTRGDGSHGIVAQSIGGGGGVAGVLSTPEFQVSTPASRSAYGNGGSVVLTMDAGSTITTSGRMAHGIVAQTIAGGGGIFGENVGRASYSGAGTTGAIVLTLNGGVSVTGEGSYGVFSQLDAPDINQAIGTELNVGGNITSAGTAVYLAGGNNTVTVDTNGLIKGETLLTQVATTDKNGQRFGQTTLYNNGTIQGSISSGSPVIGNPPQTSASSTFAAQPNLSAALNSVSVVNRGLFLAGSSIEADLRNEGQFVVGRNALNQVGETSRVKGDFVQTSTGKLVFDVDFKRGVGDLLTIKGDAELGGAVRVKFDGDVANREVKILSVDGDFTNNLTTDNGRAEGEYGIYDFVLRSEANRVFVRPVVDFSPEGLSISGNSRQIANYLERIWEARTNQSFGGLFDALDGLLQNEPASYSAALQQLSPAASLAFASNTLSSQQAFVDAAFGQKVLEGGSAKPVEVQSVWANTYGGSTAAEGYDLNSFTSDVGGQWEISPHFFIGGALGYQHDSLDDDSGSVSGNGDTGMAAFTMKYEPGDWSFAAALTGSVGDFDTKRRVNIPGNVDVFEGSPSVESAGLVGRVGYTFHNEKAYIRPQATGSLVYVHSGSYTENGSSSSRLSVDSESETAFVFTPGFETGLRTDLKNGMVLRSYVSCGLSIATGGSWEQDARFAGAPAGAGSFTASLPRDTVSGQVTAGGQLQFTDTVTGYLEYQGQFSEDSNVNGGALGVKLRF
ncbi:MAG: autotransporter outer membrane beta-barrel domain-containing protein [Luteolibacter sp.]